MSPTCPYTCNSPGYRHLWTPENRELGERKCNQELKHLPFWCHMTCSPCCKGARDQNQLIKTRSNWYKNIQNYNLSLENIKLTQNKLWNGNLFACLADIIEEQISEFLIFTLCNMNDLDLVGCASCDLPSSVRLFDSRQHFTSYKFHQISPKCFRFFNEYLIGSKVYSGKKRWNSH
jgi:hypothetical protein